MKSTASKPDIVWTPLILFIATAIVAIIGVPLWGYLHDFSATAWITFSVLMIFGGISITGGYHRLWSHKAYDAHPILKVFFALFGGMTLQNSILVWATGHRRHHRHVDDNDKDPYSAGRGFWFSHMGWMIRHYPSGELDFSNGPDLQRDPIVMWQHRYYLAVAIGMNVGLPLAIGWLAGDMMGVFLLGSVLRLFLTHHFTFFINSLCHMWGSQPYSDQHSAKDNGLLALVTYGEGYHNFHHSFQNDYRNGLRWWQFDPTKWMIAACSWVGLASRLNRCNAIKIQQARMLMQFKKAKLVDKQSHPNLAALVEAEYQQFLNTLSTWRELKQKWVEDKKEELMAKWENTDIRTQIKTLESTLKLQSKRLQLIIQSPAFQTA